MRPRVYEALSRELDDDEDGQRLPTVRLVKVHDAYTLTPKGEPLLSGARAAQGAIVIVRDPRDVAPSLASHISKSMDEAIAFLNDQKGSFSSTLHDQPAQLRQKLPGWSGHVESWLDQRDVPIHLVRYEDLQEKTVETFARALDRAHYPATAEQIHMAVELASFSRLQHQEREKGFGEAPRRDGKTSSDGEPWAAGARN